MEAIQSSRTSTRFSAYAPEASFAAAGIWSRCQLKLAVGVKGMCLLQGKQGMPAGAVGGLRHNILVKGVPCHALHIQPVTF